MGCSCSGHDVGTGSLTTFNFTWLVLTSTGVVAVPAFHIQLRKYDGSDPNKTILVAVNGRIYNVWRVTKRSSLPDLPRPALRCVARRCVRGGLTLIMCLRRLSGPLTVRVWRYI
jgi:hypothetical protein